MRNTRTSRAQLRKVIDFVRRRTLARDDDPARLARDVRAQAKRAFLRLEAGLGDYAPVTGDPRAKAAKT